MSRAGRPSLCVESQAFALRLAMAPRLASTGSHQLQNESIGIPISAHRNVVAGRTPASLGDVAPDFGCPAAHGREGGGRATRFAMRPF